MRKLNSCTSECQIMHLIMNDIPQLLQIKCANLQLMLVKMMGVEERMYVWSWCWFDGDDDDNGGRGDRWSAQISICLPASKALKQHFPKLKIQNVTFVDKLTWFMQTILYDFINLRSHTTLQNQWNSTRNWDLRAPFRKKGNCLTLMVDWLFWYNGAFVSFNEVISQLGISCTPQTKERSVMDHYCVFLSTRSLI